MDVYSFAERIEDFFKGLALLVFYPFSCIYWTRLCARHEVQGKKRFKAYSVLGFVSWLLVVAGSMVSGSARTISFVSAAVVYLLFLIMFIFLSTKKVKEIREKKENKNPRSSSLVNEIA